MSPRLKTTLSIVVLFLILSCQAASMLVEGTTIQPSSTPFPSQISNQPSQTQSPLGALPPTDAISIVPKNTDLPLLPSLTNTLEISPSEIVTPSPLQLAIFEELWQIINDEYLYPDFNGLDWDAIHQEYLERVQNGMSNDQFYLAMDEMIFRLGDDHSVFLNPQEAAEEDAQYSGDYDYVGVGILVSAVPERDRGVILLTFPGSPAEQAGLEPHDSILAVDGESILDEDGFLRDIIRGPEGSTIELTIQSPGQDPRTVSLKRRRINGAIPVPYVVLTTSSGLRIGYIFLVTFADNSIDDQVATALKTMSKDAPLDGLILDNRYNEGGVDTVMRDTLAYFTKGTLGFFISRGEEHPLQVKGEDIGGSQKIPLVVLIDMDTVSFGEVSSGVLQDLGRAYLIGERTEGNVEILWGYDFEDGSRAWIAHESFRPFNHPDADWEKSGITPDLEVISSWDQYTPDNDPALQESLSYFDGK